MLASEVSVKVLWNIVNIRQTNLPALIPERSKLNTTADVRMNKTAILLNILILILTLFAIEVQAELP